MNIRLLHDDEIHKNEIRFYNKTYMVNVLKFRTLYFILFFFFFFARILLFIHLFLKILCGMANSVDLDEAV